jgi:hypothetical protein
MPTQNPRSQIARKVNFAIQLLREASELLEASQGATPARHSRYPRRSPERDEWRSRVPAVFGLPAFALLLFRMEAERRRGGAPPQKETKLGQNTTPFLISPWASSQKGGSRRSGTVKAGHLE